MLAKCIWASNANDTTLECSQIVLHPVSCFSAWTFANIKKITPSMFELQTFIRNSKCSQHCATSNHLVSTRRNSIWLTSVPHFLRVGVYASRSHRLFHLMSHSPQHHFSHTYIEHYCMILILFPVDSWLDAQVRADWGRAILRKGKQRLNLRALQRPLLGSNPASFDRPSLLLSEKTLHPPSSIIISFLCSPELCY